MRDTVLEQYLAKMGFLRDDYLFAQQAIYLFCFSLLKQPLFYSHLYYYYSYKKILCVHETLLCKDSVLCLYFYYLISYFIFIAFNFKFATYDFIYRIFFLILSPENEQTSENISFFLRSLIINQ